MFFMNISASPFAAYIDFAAQLSPSLVLVGGVYNFEIERTDALSLNDVPVTKPQIGCRVSEEGVSYLFLLLRFSAEIDSLESCEVKIQKPDRTICWRMAGDRIFSLSNIEPARGALSCYSEQTMNELHSMQTQFNQRFGKGIALNFLDALSPA